MIEEHNGWRKVDADMISDMAFEQLRPLMLSTTRAFVALGYSREDMNETILPLLVPIWNRMHRERIAKMTADFELLAREGPDAVN
jgi:hypothetical protein